MPDAITDIFATANSVSTGFTASGTFTWGTTSPPASKKTLTLTALSDEEREALLSWLSQ